MTDQIATKPRPFCFVLMPFSEAFDDVYQIGIKEACERGGAYCERVDEQIFEGSMLQRIYNQIAKADIIIADMTGKNANVFYEAGYAHALGKVTILLTQDAADIPFDLKHFPHIVYGSKVSDLREMLQKRVAHYVENPPTKQSDVKLDVELFLGDKRLSSGDVEFVWDATLIADSQLSIQNLGQRTYAPGELRVGIIAPNVIRVWASHGERSFSSSWLPDRRIHYVWPQFDTLFPESVDSIPFRIKHVDAERFDGTLTVRVFSKEGTRDFPVRVRTTLADGED